jgi:predicted metal-binding membrane protein
LLAHAVDAAVQVIAARSDWVLLHGWAIGATALAGAGLFQFSGLKYRCLQRCHAPFGFVASRWHGRAPRAEAVRLGADHGVFCVGCCWSLMMVMFVVGIGSIGWMLALALVMAAEKNLPWGRLLRTPLGLGLIAAAVVLVAINQ